MAGEGRTARKCSGPGDTGFASRVSGAQLQQFCAVFCTGGHQIVAQISVEVQKTATELEAIL
jgi:hypothetical protein